MKNAAVFFADGFEEIEALTTVDLLRRAGINVITVSINDSELATGAHGIPIVADLQYEDAALSQMDILILPGGLPGATNLGAFEPLCDQLKEFDAKGKYIAAICAAPTVFGALGLVNGKKATCYPGCEDALKGAEYLTDTVVVCGNTITSRGPATAMPFALKLIEVLLGKEASDKRDHEVLFSKENLFG